MVTPPEKSSQFPRVTPLGWSLPVGIGILMIGAAVTAMDSRDGLHPEIERTIETLHVAPAAQAPLGIELVAVTDLQKSCDPVVETQALATAVIELDILAPCDPGRSVEVSHDGLRVSAILDDVGRAVITMPALRAAPNYLIDVAGREPVLGTGDTLDFPAYSRTVLLAAPDTGFELHAYEGAAKFGDAGHVQPGQPYDPVRALVGAGGFLAKVGTPSLMGSRVAQVYTAPEGTDADLSLEAEVTEANCGRHISALTIRPKADGPPKVTPWNLSMPDCDSLGEIILLGTIGH